MAEENGATETTALEEEHGAAEYSYWPVVVAVSVLLIGIGFLSHPAVSVAGGVLLVAALVGWFYEPWVF